MRVDTKTKEDFINRANEVLEFRNLTVLDVLDWRNSGCKHDFKIKVVCNKCNFERVSTLKSLNDKRRNKCINCESYQVRWNNDRIISMVDILYENMGIIIDTARLNITNSKSILFCKCRYDGFEWEDSIHNIINSKKKKCSICNNSGSRYEITIKNYLDNKNIKYIREYSFDDFKRLCGKRRCRFDFYLPDMNTIIEMHGEQHFKVNSTFGSVSKEEAMKRLLENQNNDKRKMEYVLSRNIKFIAIRYDEDIISRLEEELINGKNI